MNDPQRRKPAEPRRIAYCPIGEFFVPGNASGFTLLEVLITIGLTAVLLAIFAASIVGTVFIGRSTTSIQAHEFIQEEFDTLRSLKFSDLLNRTNGNWLGVPFNRGAWAVANKDVGAYSGSQVMELGESASPSLYGETGLSVLPGNYRTDFTFSSAINVQSASPSGWGAALAFRYRDAENHYRLRISAGGMALERVYQGTTTTLATDSYAFTGNGSTWYVIEVDMTGNAITAKRNGTTVISTTDDYFESGDLALMSVGDCLVWFDDVSVTEDSVTETWDFEDASYLNEVPDDWKRLSCLDLIDGSCTLTIEDYLGETTIKEVTAKVSWSESNRTRTAEGKTLITE